MEAVLAWAGEVGDGLDDMTPEQRKAVLQLVLDDAIIDKHNQVRINLAIPVEVSVSIASASSAGLEGDGVLPLPGEPAELPD